MSGAFVTFEGCEGCGKSTQLRLLAARLLEASVPVLVTREPGGTAIGERIRELLLDPEHDAMAASCELLLYEASRAQLVAEVIEPALARGEVVLCDRFSDSTTAYQGFGRGLPLDQIAALNLAATAGVQPDRTILLDLDAALGVQRATAQSGADRLEAEDFAFHERVREGFLSIARDEPGRIRVVDANGTPEDVAERVVDALRDLPVIARALS